MQYHNIILVVYYIYLWIFNFNVLSGDDRTSVKKLQAKQAKEYMLLVGLSIDLHEWSHYVSMDCTSLLDFGLQKVDLGQLPDVHPNQSLTPPPQ